MEIKRMMFYANDGSLGKSIEICQACVNAKAYKNDLPEYLTVSKIIGNDFSQKCKICNYKCTMDAYIDNSTSSCESYTGIKSDYKPITVNQYEKCMGVFLTSIIYNKYGSIDELYKDEYLSILRKHFNMNSNQIIKINGNNVLVENIARAACEFGFVIVNYDSNWTKVAREKIRNIDCSFESYLK